MQNSTINIESMISELKTKVKTIANYDFDFLLISNVCENTKWKLFFKNILPTQYTQLIESLTNDKINLVLEILASYEETPLQLLSELTCHSSEEVRLCVSDNPNVSRLLLFLLACDESMDVRLAMAENLNLPTDILEKLSFDENTYISHKALISLRKIENKHSTIPMPIMINIRNFEKLAQN